MTQFITHEQARRFYDRIGRGLDARPLSERRALDALAAQGDFTRASSVLEFGCGTGRFAARLLREKLPEGATYLGLDVSPRMAGLARAAVAPWAGRARVELSDGAIRLPVPDASADRVVSTYVLDLLSPADAAAFAAEARRVLRPGGRLALASLAPGHTPAARLVTRLWQALWRLNPALLGGCRPLRVSTAARPRGVDGPRELPRHGLVPELGRPGRHTPLRTPRSRVFAPTCGETFVYWQYSLNVVRPIGIPHGHTALFRVLASSSRDLPAKDRRDAPDWSWGRMNDTYGIFVTATMLAALVSLVVAVFALRRRHVPGAGALSAMMFAGAFWCATYAGELLATTEAAKDLWARAEYIGIVLIGPCWLLFSLRYTGKLQKRSWTAVVLLFVVPITTLILAFGGTDLGLIWSDASMVRIGGADIYRVVHGPWFWVHVSYSYGCLLIGAVVLMTTVLGEVKPLTRQGGLMVLAVALPWIANIVTLFFAQPRAGLDLTPPCIVLSGAIAAVSLSRYGALQVFPGMVPVARDIVVQGMRDGVIVVGRDGVVLSANTAAERLLGAEDRAPSPDRPSYEYLAGMPEAARPDGKDGPERHEYSFEATLGPADDRRHVEVVRLPAGGEPALPGLVLSMRDVTERLQAAGRARAQGAARRADRPAQPRAAARAPQGTARPAAPGRRAAGAADAGPGPLQGDQRHVRSRGRRRGAADCRQATPRPRSARATSWRGSAATSSP